MAEVFAGAILQVLFEKLASAGINQVLKHVKGKKKVDPKTISNLKNSLRMVAAMLNDAQQRRIQSEAYTVWVEDLQDMVYDLEDILDEVATDALLLQLQQDDDGGSGPSAPGARSAPCLRSARTMVKNIVACGSGAMRCFQCLGSGDLPSKIKEISSRLQESHIQGRDRLGLSDQTIIQQEMYPSVKSSRETTSLTSEQIIYGREEKKNEIIQMLLKEEPGNKNYVVIPIVGKGGIGKTTLAQYVYNDHQLNDHFELKAWVCVSDDEFEVTRVTMDIINSAIGENLTFSNLNQSQHKLAEVVKDKRFLIVLDDVWTERWNDWKQLQTPFLHSARGSKIMVTTRMVDIARMMSENQTYNIINLENLSDDDCWRLFKRHANQESDDGLAEMKNDIIRRCDGLPLAAKALGGLFNKKVEKSQRQSLLESGIWGEEGDVLPVLRLSYFHLPSHLKHIFAYSSILPKDYEFEEMEIIILWMAQGMLPENREESMEVIGHHYFLELVSSSLFERSPSSYDELYVMHDLVHDLSLWAAGDICLCVMDTKALQTNPTRTRHLNLYTNITNRVDQCTSAQQLRTFLCQPKGYIDSLNLGDFISRFESIRTLYLASDTITELPECIGDLKLLRYLKLDFPYIVVLPETIGRLCNLQMLLLSDCDNLGVSIDLSFLVKLRHMRFPDSLWEAVPVGIRKLTNLRTLGDMILEDDHGSGCLIKELRNLNHLHGELNIIGIENVRNVEDAQEAQLHEKKGLEQLHLKWSGDGEDEVDDETKRDVLEQLKPNSCIKKCKLDGYSGLTLPSWLGDPSFKDMVNIKIVDCEKCERLPPLGQLPSLKKLRVEGMNAWARWLHDSKATFPCLEKLVIKECESFKGNLPPHLPCLKILWIENCPLARVFLPNSQFEELKIERCEELVPSTRETIIINCSKRIILRYIKLGFIGLLVDGPCHEQLLIRDCNSLVTIDKIPLTVGEAVIENCGKLERVEWEEALRSASDNNRVSIDIIDCHSIVNFGNIPSTVKRLWIENCKSLGTVKCDNQWNLFNSSEATDGDGGDSGGGRLQLAHLVHLVVPNSCRCQKMYCCLQYKAFPCGIMIIKGASQS